MRFSFHVCTPLNCSVRLRSDHAGPHNFLEKERRERISYTRVFYGALHPECFLLRRRDADPKVDRRWHWLRNVTTTRRIFKASGDHPPDGSPPGGGVSGTLLTHLTRGLQRARRRHQTSRSRIVQSAKMELQRLGGSPALSVQLDLIERYIRIARFGRFNRSVQRCLPVYQPGLFAEAG